ncbi:MAG: 3-oxoacyl-[acyl-carrier-protein] reductase [Clostridia bacterium]|nr:3-oxoacyl-[acyl-carrier-protein] reductase [Clostridia bacterium]MDD4048529.1 3-oxoacyl-[acyl-carrier-protein] reductase [Clostridia bacterium]
MLADKVALITGASRGIGRATALVLAQKGAKVIINYKGNEEAAKEVLDKVHQLGAEGDIICADVSSSEQVDNMVKKVLAKHGRIDILVNNAGITRDTLIVRMKDEEWNKVIDTNLTAAFNCLRAVARSMMKQKSGKIINIASVVGLHGNAGQINYASAKAGIIGMTKSAAKELAIRGIIVNAIAPGFIVTDMTNKLSDEVKEKLAQEIPLRRLGRPEDVANMVAFLAEPETNYITGQIISVDGGMSM